MDASGFVISSAAEPYRKTEYNIIKATCEHIIIKASYIIIKAKGKFSSCLYEWAR